MTKLLASDLSRSVEDYLKVIYHLTEAGEPASTTAIAEALDLAAPSVSGMIKRLAEADWQAVVELRRNKLKKVLESLLNEPEWPAGCPATRREEWIRHRGELLAILRHRGEIGRAVAFARGYWSEPRKRLGYQRIRPRVKPRKNP